MNIIVELCETHLVGIWDIGIWDIIHILSCKYFLSHSDYIIGMGASNPIDNNSNQSSFKPGEIHELLTDLIKSKLGDEPKATIPETTSVSNDAQAQHPGTVYTVI